VMNEYVCVPGKDATLKLQHCKATSRTVLLFTVSDAAGASAFSDHTHSRNWFKRPTGAWQRITADIQPDRFGGGAADHTQGLANYLFVDGHVEAIAAQARKEQADRNENFAKPPQR
jgi:prepilin-type processing-associated H-X9-DG protein